ncbi:MAG TPA: biopolymer transporter ExbD [Kofleriaceae bacterium]|jgi:hypothetical protein
MRAAVVLALLCGCLVTPPIKFGAGKSAQEAQEVTLGKLMPPQLVTEPSLGTEIRTEKLRVWADDEYRAQNLHWQQTFQDELDYANAVLAPLLGIRYVAEYQEWHRHAPGTTLEDDLAALAQQDPGDGVFTVVGLTSSLGLTTATFDAIGVASLPGNHVMLRGYADLEERRAFDLAFPKIPPDDREAVLEARRRHKTTGVLLHELGHNFGAPHDQESDTLMNPFYSDKAAAFDERSLAIMRRTLDARLGRTPVVAAAPAMLHAQLVVGLTATGGLVLGGQSIDLDTFDELLRRTYADDPATEVVVRTARGAPQARAMDVLSHAKAAGFQRMSIAPGE